MSNMSRKWKSSRNDFSLKPGKTLKSIHRLKLVNNANDFNQTAFYWFKPFFNENYISHLRRSTILHCMLYNTKQQSTSNILFLVSYFSTVLRLVSLPWPSLLRYFPPCRKLLLANDPVHLQHKVKVNRRVNKTSELLRTIQNHLESFDRLR